jgi:hypothetical protein
MRANPGKVSYGSAGSGSSPHLAGEMFKRAAKVEATHVPYKGAAPALNDLLGGQIQFMFDPGPGFSTCRRASCTAIAVASAKRASQYPDMRNADELGVQVDADTTFGVYAPSASVPAIVERMNREINKTLARRRSSRTWRGLGGAVAPMTIQEFVDRQSAERARFRRVHQGSRHQGRVNLDAFRCHLASSPGCNEPCHPGGGGSQHGVSHGHRRSPAPQGPDVSRGIARRRELSLRLRSMEPGRGPGVEAGRAHSRHRAVAANPLARSCIIRTSRNTSGSTSMSIS